MSLKIDRVQLEFMINNDPARKKIHELDKQISDLQRGLKGLKKNSDEYAAGEKEIKKLRLEQDKIRDSIGISNMTMKELIKTQRTLNATLRDLRPGTKEYEELEKQAGEVNNRIKELRSNSRETQKQLEKPLSGKGGFHNLMQ